jgi:uncharacterized cupin superfamily protein
LASRPKVASGRGCPVPVLSGVVSEEGEGFLVLGGATRVKVRSSVRPAELSVGDRVVVTAQLRGAEWVAEDVRVEG